MAQRTKINDGENEEIIMWALPGASTLCTEPLYIFIERYVRIIDFFMMTADMAATVDDMRSQALDALADINPEKYKKKKESTKDRVMFERLQQFAAYQSEIITIRSVDNFYCYISDILQHAMSKRPEMLKSREMVSLEDILNFSRNSDLVKFLVDRKINELSYGGIDKLQEFIKNRIGLKITSNKKQLQLLKIGIELRNIYTHNRGKVNDLFIHNLFQCRVSCFSPNICF